MNVSIRYIVLAMFAAVILASCSQTAYEGLPESTRREVTIFAAASLKDAFNDIGKLVEKEDSTVRVIFNFGASNTLARQIEQGAPVDVFASAASIIMDSLDARGFTVRETRYTFANNTIVVVGAKGDASITSLEALKDSRFRRITVAAPGVPARIYGEEVLRKAGVWDNLVGRFVYGENVRQVVEYVAGGEAEAGLVYATDATQFQQRVSVIYSVPSSMHRPITYPIAILKNGRNRAGADAFMRVLQSPKGIQILRSYGFPIPGR